MGGNGKRSEQAWKGDLAARELQALAAHAGVVALRARHDEFVCLRQPRGLANGVLTSAKIVFKISKPC